MSKSVVIRGTLYAAIAFLTPMVGLLGAAVDAEAWPSAIQFAATGSAGILAALTALRAFIDGSNERSKQNGKTQTTV